MPVRLCAEGCVIREGPVDCSSKLRVAVRRVPEEDCRLVPRNVCGQVTRLEPVLVAREVCGAEPQQSCQLRCCFELASFTVKIGQKSKMTEYAYK